MLANWETFKATVGEENIADPSAASIWVNKRLNGLCYICDTDGRYGRWCSLPSLLFIFRTVVLTVAQ